MRRDRPDLGKAFLAMVSGVSENGVYPQMVVLIGIIIVLLRQGHFSCFLSSKCLWLWFSDV